MFESLIFSLIFATLLFSLLDLISFIIKKFCKKKEGKK